MTASNPFIRHVVRFSRVAALAGLAVLGSGCSTPSLTEELAKQQERRDEKFSDMADEAESNRPDWFMAEDATPPPGVLLGYGTFLNVDMQRAMDRATLIARKNVSVAMSQKISALVKEFYTSTGDGTEGYSDFSEVVQAYLPETEASGAQVVKQKLVREGKGFRAFVVVSMNIDEARLRRDARLTADRMHAELEKRNAETRAAESGGQR